MSKEKLPEKAKKVRLKAGPKLPAAKLEAAPQKPDTLADIWQEIQQHKKAETIKPANETTKATAEADRVEPEANQSTTEIDNDEDVEAINKPLETEATDEPIAIELNQTEYEVEVQLWPETKQTAKTLAEQDPADQSETDRQQLIADAEEIFWVPQDQAETEAEPTTAPYNLAQEAEAESEATSGVPNQFEQLINQRRAEPFITEPLVSPEAFNASNWKPPEFINVVQQEAINPNLVRKGYDLEKQPIFRKLERRRKRQDRRLKKALTKQSHRTNELENSQTATVLELTKLKHNQTRLERTPPPTPELVVHTIEQINQAEPKPFNYYPNKSPETRPLATKTPEKVRYHKTPHLQELQIEAPVAERKQQLPKGHRIEQSAWHSIEVDEKTGHAVENPFFDYGEEFKREKRQEVWHQDEEEVAVASGQLAVGGSTNVSLSGGGGIVSSSPPVMASVVHKLDRIESSIRESRPISSALNEVGLWVILGVIIIAIALAIFG